MESELTIDIFRHAEARNNTRLDLISGKSPEARITAQGFKQAKRLNQRLRQEGIIYDQVYISPLKRVRSTAVLALANVYPLSNVVEIPEIEELEQGDWAGKPRDQVYGLHTLNKINAQGKFFVPPNGESLRMVERRFSNWFEDEVLYNPRYQDGNSQIGIFTSGTALKCFLHYVMGFNDRMIFKTAMENTALNRLRFNEGGWWVDKFNDTAHLYQPSSDRPEPIGLTTFSPDETSPFNGALVEGDFGLQMEAYRNFWGLSRNELGILIDFDSSYVYRLEKNVRRIGRKSLPALIRELRLTEAQTSQLLTAANFKLDVLKT